MYITESAYECPYCGCGGLPESVLVEHILQEHSGETRSKVSSSLIQHTLRQDEVSECQ
jgi:hypothetical protein